MLFRVVATAVLAVACGSFSVDAQGVRQISGPREVPPASFDGEQYVDSRGCVFVRAGLGGTTAWVPRVSNNRKVLCGFPPTFAQLPEAAEPPSVQVATAPAAQPVVTQPAPAARRAAAPSPVAVAPATPATSRAAQPAQVDIAAGPGCPARAPIAQRFALQGGGSAVLCLSREGQVSDRAVTVSPGVAAPVRVASGQATRTELVCPGSAPVAKRFALTDGGTTVLCTRGDGTLDGMTAPYRRAVTEAGVAVAAAAPPAPVPRAAAPVIPKGYRAAWNDDRLNPNRGRGTAEGQAAQDRVWTRQTPARLVATPAQAAVQVSTKSAPVGRSFVQVGTFGQPANAEGARARLAALGLPVSGGSLTKGGKALQVVYAGPFADAGQAQAALGAARRAGFTDAFIK